MLLAGKFHYSLTIVIVGSPVAITEAGIASVLVRVQGPRLPTAGLAAQAGALDAILALGR